MGGEAAAAILGICGNLWYKQNVLAASRQNKTMLILAFDTSTQHGSLALLEDDLPLAEWNLRSSVPYLQRLLPDLDRLLAATGKTLTAVKLLVVSAGPGNFTGLRLGLATAKGLALVLGCPVIAVNTLDALAANFPQAALPVCPLLDAKKQELYAAFYHCRSGLERRSDYLLLPPAALMVRVQEPTLFTGPAVERYGALLQQELGSLAVLAPPELWQVRAPVLARLGRQEWAAGRIPGLDQLTPFYLRGAPVDPPPS